MLRNTLVALVSAAALAGIAVPAMAASDVEAPIIESPSTDDAFGGGSPEMREFVANSVLIELQRKGINATAVEDWSGLVRAYVTLEDGSQVMQFFTPGSLQPVVF